MKKVIYIPNQRKEAYFNKGTLDWEQQREARKQLEEARRRNRK